jgi:hypothetical protein
MIDKRIPFDTFACVKIAKEIYRLQIIEEEKKAFSAQQIN